MMIRVGLLWQREPCKVFGSFEGLGITVDIKCLLPYTYKGDDSDRCYEPIGGKELALTVHWPPRYHKNLFNRWRGWENAPGLSKE